MSYKNKTYVIFDGDNDMWAYARMKGWKALENIDFDFSDAHDLKPLTNQARSEDYIKQRLAERMASAKQVIVLIGESTKNLYLFVRWELDKALSNKIPIIVVNLNNKKSIDYTLCPPIIRNENAIHIPFRMKIIKYALDEFPPFHMTIDLSKKEDWHYKDSVYQSLGLND